LRHTGSKDRLSRKFGEILSGMPDFEISKRPYPPGQHGQKRSKSSEYGGLLHEKQKLRLSYGISEKQFSNYFQKANKVKGPTGEILITLLETRLDNVVYRMGFTSTLSAARQLVSHGHVLVNGKKIDIPSYPVKAGSEISLREKVAKLDVVKEALKNNPQVLDYLKVDKDACKGKLVEMPNRAQVPVIINERLIVEYYSR